MATETHNREQALAATTNRVFPAAFVPVPAGDSPAMKAAFDAIDRDAARTTIKLTKSTARMFLAVETRWRLNLLWKGLEVMDRAWHLPSYQTFSRRIDIRGARLAFRWVRFVDSRARQEETVMAF